MTLVGASNFEELNISKLDELIDKITLMVNEMNGLSQQNEEIIKQLKFLALISERQQPTESTISEIAQ